MLDIRPTRDVDAMMAVINRPGIWRHITGGVDKPADPLAVLNDPRNRFFLASDYGTNLGFTAYLYIEPGIYSIHNCLLTIGSRSIQAIKESLRLMALDGANLIVSAYPESNRAAKMMAEKIGFSDDTTGLVKRLIPVEADEPYLYQFKEVSKVTTI